MSIPAAIWSQPRSIQFLQLSDGLWRGIEVEFILGYMDGLLIPTFHCVGETSLCSISRSKLNVTLTQHGFKSRIESVMRFVVGICRIRFSVLGFVDWMLEGVKFHVEARRTPFFWTSRMLDVIVACNLISPFFCELCCGSCSGLLQSSWSGVWRNGGIYTHQLFASSSGWCLIDLFLGSVEDLFY